MNAKFQDTKRGTWAYIQKKVRIDGRSTTRTIKRLGLLEDIANVYGCEDPRQWVIDLARKMTEEERADKEKVSIDLYPDALLSKGQSPLRCGGDLLMLPIYNKLGINQICKTVVNGGKTKYDLAEIVRTLVMGRLLFPSSKRRTLEDSKSLVNPPKLDLEDVYRALSLLADHIDDIQTAVWENSKQLIKRNTRVIYYDCTNYFFEIESNDRDSIDVATGEFIPGLRKRGKSKEHRPNPIVQMGLLMDGDGIPLAFLIFPGNESEQPSLQRIEEMVARKFGLNEFIISTDAGLASEDNRRYNMTEQREYIVVQSIPSLSEEDQSMALDTRGWRVAWRDNQDTPINENDPEQEIFDLSKIDLYKERHTRFYKEIIVVKYIKGKKSTARPERVIVTYSHDYALFLKEKRAERVEQAEKIVRNKLTSSRQSQQDPRRYVSTTYLTAKGEQAEKISMAVNYDAINEDERFDGFYAYATSLDDDAIDVLRARSFHHEIEHLFRTSKSFLDARPVFLRRHERIKSHFLICFLAMVTLKILQKQLAMPQVSIDMLIDTLRNFRFGLVQGNYTPMFQRNDLTDRSQTIADVQVSTQIIKAATMRNYYRKVNKS